MKKKEKNLVVFQNEEFGSIRVKIDDQGETWFVGRDIAITLGYSNTSTALDRHVEEEDKQLSELVDYQLYEKSITDNQENREVPKWQKVVWVNESGVFSLILGSKLPNAKKYKHWVTSEVLPSIHRTGKYGIEPIPIVTPEEIEMRKMEAQAGIDTARVAAATLFERLAEKYPIISYRNILYSYSANTLAGTLVLPFPEVTEKTYTATEVGVVLGLSANKVGRIANSLGLKHEKGTEGDYGKWFEDKSKYSNKEVETFRYNQKGIDKLKECLDLANDNEVE